MGGEREGRQQADDATLRPFQVGVAFVRLLRRALAVIARDEGDDLDLLGIEAAQVAVPDQVMRVLVMAAVADMDADVVQERPEFQPLALARSEAVASGGLIEQRGRGRTQRGGVIDRLGQHRLGAVPQRRDGGIDQDPAFFLRGQMVALAFQLQTFRYIFVGRNPAAVRHRSTGDTDQAPIGKFVDPA